MNCVSRYANRINLSRATQGVIKQTKKNLETPEFIKPDISAMTALDIVGKQRRGEILNNYEQKICDRYLSEYYDDLGLIYGNSRINGRIFL